MGLWVILLAGILLGTLGGCVQEAKSKTIAGPVSGLAVDVIEPMYRYCLTTLDEAG